MTISKPCPVCGSNNVKYSIDGEHFVDCLNCKFFVMANTESGVIRQWNQRKTK